MVKMKITYMIFALCMAITQIPTARAAGPSDANLDGMGRAIGIDVNHHPGKVLFAANCAACHEGGVPKAPHRDFLQTLPPASILSALDDGVMRQQAAHLAAGEKRAIAEYLTLTDLRTQKPVSKPIMCAAQQQLFEMKSPPAISGWGYDNRRFVKADDAGLTAGDVPKLKLRWAFAFPEALRARSQPVVAMGAVFVGSQNGTIYAFDLKTGCARWISKVSAEVRTAIVVESWPKGAAPSHRPRLFFGDLLSRVYAMDAQTGQLLWRTRPDAHPNATITGTPILSGDTLYVPISSLEVVTAADPNYQCCTFRGSVAALNASTGAMKWQHYTVVEAATEHSATLAGMPIMGPSGAPVWGSPTIDFKRGQLYHGSGENYSSPADDNSDAVFAVDLKTGARTWRQQLTKGDAWNMACILKNNPNCPKESGPDFDISASPLLIDGQNGRQMLVIGAKSGFITGLDPDDRGKILWQTRVGRGSIQGGVHFGMAAEGTRIYVPIVDIADNSDGTRSTEQGNAGLHALDAMTGRILWSVPAPAKCGERRWCDSGISAAVTAIEGVVFAGHLDGWFRAYAGDTGRVLWEFDTSLPVAGTNGEIAHGGSISGPGAAVAEGHVIVTSGYGFSNHMPGNALLVFGVDP